MINARRLKERAFPHIEHAYGQKDTRLYALSLGFGEDPLDMHSLPYVYEGVDGRSLRAFPVMVNVLAYPGFWARKPDTGIDWRRVVHAEQHITWHASLPSHGTVAGRNRVTDIWDRGPGKGAFLQQRRELSDAASGELLATVTQLNLLRGDGGFGEGASDGAPPAPHAMPTREPDAICDLATLPQAALLYRLCGDDNPLHADPEVARVAGFERPILHGMAIMGIAARAVLARLAGHDADRLAAMRVRFTAPAMPGDTLRHEMWVDGGTVSLRVTALERKVVLLDNAFVELRPI